jgi:hypothetical protein
MQFLSSSVRKTRLSRLLALLAAASALPLAQAGERLVATSGVTQIEGAAGGGLTPWAVIAGGGSRNQIGASGALTRLRTDGGFELSSAGVAVGFYDSVELSAARWRFGLSDTVPGQHIGMDVLGLKWRVLGDAVYDADSALPQLSVGLQYKHNRDMAVPTALGARHASDAEPYAVATKVWLGAAGGYNLLTSLGLRATRANQFGLLGFGGDKGDSRKLQTEAALAVLPSDKLAIGAEYRSKPDKLSVFPEERALSVFAAWWPMKNLSLTAAWVDLGQIANKPGQKSYYLSLQLQH